ncbi:MAG TPA: hypothetical protein VL970_04380 [Candidatus Acidoferrales bacterium]|nr:hypothetical protein [Candidatus Acidoferrales bacterium]
MDDGNGRLREKLAKLLDEAAAAKVALDRSEGRIKGVPHYSVIEDAAHEVGQQVSRLVQQRHMRELVANQSLSAKCPKCGRQEPLTLKTRRVTSGDGPVELDELAGDCSYCRRTFFPSAGNVGI